MTIDLLTSSNFVKAGVYVYSSLMEGFWIIMLILLLMWIIYIATDNIASTGFVGLITSTIVLFGQNSYIRELGVNFGSSQILLYFTAVFSFALTLYDFFGKR
jgi:hypothetical protein